MSESRGAYIQRIFQSNSQRGEERNAVANARRKERQERNFANTVRLGMDKVTSKFKQFFQSRPVTQSKVTRETHPAVLSQETCRQQKTTLKKPPFIVPGKIRHNDLHLIQAIPHTKDPPKKPLRSNIKTSCQYGSSKQVSFKAIPAMSKPSKSRAIAPESQGFVAPAGIERYEESIAEMSMRKKGTFSGSHSQENYLCNDAPQKKTCTPHFEKNPWITTKRECSTQKQFTSLFGSLGSPAPPLSYFDDESDQGSSSSDDLVLRDTIERQKITYFGKNPKVEENCDEHFNLGVDISKEESSIKLELAVRTSQNGEEDLSAKCEAKSPQITQIVPPNVEGNQMSPQSYESNIVIAEQLRFEMNEEKVRLNELCDYWNNVLEKVDSVPESEVGTVLTVIRQTQQLQRERFNQYSDLIDQFENNSGPKTIIKSDLDGFWEMILLQVKDVDKKFNGLEQLQKNNWVPDEDLEPKEKEKKPKKKVERKKSSCQDGIDVKSGIRSHIAALRKKQLESVSPIQCNPVLGASGSDNEKPTEFTHSSENISSTTKEFEQQTSTNAEACSGEGSPANNNPLKGDEKQTPVYMKLMRKMRQKHKSAPFVQFFSPLRTSSPRLRSHSSDTPVNELRNQISPTLPKNETLSTNDPSRNSTLSSPFTRNSSQQPDTLEENSGTPTSVQSPIPYKEENNNDPQNFPVINSD